MKLVTHTVTRLRDNLRHSGQRPSVVLSEAYETLARSGMLGPEESVALERVDPFGEVMYLASIAQGGLGKEERDVIRGALRELSDGLLRSGTINVMLEAYAERFDREGMDGRLEALARDLAEERSWAECALALAAAVALADDLVTENEQSFLEQLERLLGISDERWSVILEQVKGDFAFE